jgi:hypothetical protein
MAEETVVGTTETSEQKETEETHAEVKTVASEQTDYEKLISDQNAKIAKLEENNSNLTKGIKKWKKVAKSDDDFEQPEPLDGDRLEEMIDQKVNQKLAESQLAQAITERDNMLSNMARELKEAKLALRNQPGSPTSTGTNERQEVETNFFTKEQLAELKARGVDPKKVIENYRKIKEQ